MLHCERLSSCEAGMKMAENMTLRSCWVSIASSQNAHKTLPLQSCHNTWEDTRTFCFCWQICNPVSTSILCSLPFKEARMLFQVWIFLRGILHHNAQLFQGEFAVFVEVCLLKKLTHSAHSFFLQRRHLFSWGVCILQSEFGLVCNSE